MLRVLGLPGRWLSSDEVVQWLVQCNWARSTMLLKNTVPYWRAADVFKALIALRWQRTDACWWLCDAMTSAGARPAADADDDADDDAAVMVKLSDELSSPYITGNLSGAHVTHVRSRLPPPYHCLGVCIITRTQQQNTSVSNCKCHQIYRVGQIRRHQRAVLLHAITCFRQVWYFGTLNNSCQEAEKNKYCLSKSLLETSCWNIFWSKARLYKLSACIRLSALWRYH